MCLLTAMEPHRCAAWANHWIIFPEQVTWPRHFAEHGYATCLVGKMHFGGKDQLHGFQHRPYGDFHHGLSHQPEPLSFFPSYHSAESAGVTEIPESLIQDVVVTREAQAFLLEHQDRKPEQPWFLCAGYGRPHAPFTAPGRYIRRYRDRIPPLEQPADCTDRLEPYAHRLYDRLFFPFDRGTDPERAGRLLRLRRLSWMTALGNCWTPSGKTACWRTPSSSTPATTGRWAGLTACGKRASTMKKPWESPFSSRARAFSRATPACPTSFP